MRIRSGMVVTAAAATVALNCAPRAVVEPPVEPEASDAITLEVINNNWLDMAIYIDRGGQRIRLMTVVATNASSMTLSPELLGPGGELRVLAYAIGQPRCLRCARRDRPDYTSPRLFAQPGTTVSVNLETDVRKSRVVIW